MEDSSSAVNWSGPPAPGKMMEMDLVLDVEVDVEVVDDSVIKVASFFILCLMED